MAGGLRAGVIGVGVLGTLHAAKYAAMPNVTLAAVADALPERARAVAERFGAYAASSTGDLVGNVDLVSVAVPTVAHHAIVRTCLEAGIHVFVEKPIARTLAEADDLVALAESRRLCLGVGHLERFNPAYVRLASEVPEPLFMQAERLARFQPRGTDVDVILDLMIHDLDLALATMKSEVVSVSACGFSVMTESIDIANAYLEFADGGVASLSASRISRDPVRKLRVFGNEVYASADLHTPQLRVERIEAARGPAVWKPDNADALQAELAAFVDGVQGVSKTFVTGREGRNALELALRVNEAIAARAQRRNARSA